MQPTDPSKIASTSNAAGTDPVSAKLKAPTKATRRIRGEIACAECRRLKIRCDRIVPCTTCIKRGCAALCPNGTIPPGEGSRFVLAATDHLRNKITRMEARMRALEDGLAIIQASESDEPHPLLSTLFDLDDDEEALLKPVQEEKTTPDDAPTLRDASGTLWLDGNGASRFFGRSGDSESLLMTSNFNCSEKPEKQNCAPPLQELDPSYLPSEINQCYQAFPLTPANICPSSVQTSIESFLPTMRRAVELCETFQEHLSWMFNIVSRKTLVREIIPKVYKQEAGSYGPHELALLLVVIGIGSLVDLDLPPYNLEAQHYYRLARATMALQPVLGAQSMITIKVLHLMSIFNGMSGKECNLEQTYILVDLAGQVALRIGFHVDPSMWGFSGREAYDRRVYFWNLMAAVLWQSLGTGRPPSLSLSYIDCQIPSQEDEDTFQEGEVPLGFGIWGFKASRECLIPITRATLAAKPPTYEAILELDRKIREFVGPTVDLSQNPDRTSVSMQAFVRTHYRELMLLHLHRAYFAQAIKEYPEDPIGSPYGKSVTTAYASACVVLDDTRVQFHKQPVLCARIWQIWSFAFTAAVVVGTVATSGAHLGLKPSPLDQLETIYAVLADAAQISNRAARALPLLHAMLERSRKAKRYYDERGSPLPPSLDEVSNFANMSGVVSRTPPKSSTYYPLDQPIPPSSTHDTSSNIVRPTPIGIPLFAPSPDELSMSYQTPSDGMGYSVALPSVARVHSHHVPSMTQLQHEPTQPMKIPTLPPLDQYNMYQHQEMSGELFRDGPALSSAFPALNQRPREGVSRGFPPDTRGHFPSQPQELAGQVEGLVDGRWDAFMDYDVMQQEASRYHHR